MRPVFAIADNIISPLAFGTAANYAAICRGESGVRQHTKAGIAPHPFYAALFDEVSDTSHINNIQGTFTKFERLLIASATDAIAKAGIDPADPQTLFIVSSTKGNVSLIEEGKAVAPSAIGLAGSASKIAAHFQSSNQPLVISNACISGLTALLTGMRMITSGKYDKAIVTGADIISSFILSGFQSFQAISAAPCRPFDAARKGINLGEAAATIVLSADPTNAKARLAGGAVTNDANHISGPSRTGEELALAIRQAMNRAEVAAADIGFISAHGTATLYNDEMESKAFGLLGMNTIPINSLKGYYGHTLGAAGLVESAIAIATLEQREMPGTKGFAVSGVSQPLQLSDKTVPVHAKHCLKTASGFGGCNAALVFSR